MTEDKKDSEEVETVAGTDAPTVPETTIPDDSEGWILAERSAWFLLEKKAENVVVLDMRGRSDVCDFFVVVSGTSDIHVGALAKHVKDKLLSEGIKPKGLEGLNEGRWALLDYFDVVIHVFHEKTREYFQLERLWGDAPREFLNPESFADPECGQRHPHLNFATAADLAGPDRG